jgi:hypothetical protein
MRRAAFLLSLLFLTAPLAGDDAPIAPQRFGSSPLYPFTWQLATNGEEYLLGWSSQTRTHFAALNDRGEVIRDAAFASAAGVVDAIAVKRDYLVVLGSNLVVVDADTLAITRTIDTHFHGNSTLATDGETALLANGSGYARILDADGDAIAPDVPFAGRQTPAIGAASARDAYLLVWLEQVDAGARLMRSVIGSNGETISAAATLITVDPERVAFGRRGVASNGSAFLVSWRSGTAVNAMLISAAGQAVAPPVTIADWDYTDAPQVAWNGREFVVVLEARTLEGEADIIALRVDAQGRPLGTVRSVAAGPQLQYHAAVATTTRSTLAVWGQFASCYAAGNGGIMARTIEPLGPVATVSRGEPAREVPAAADAGETTLVAWVERGAVRGVRAVLLPSGTEIDVDATSYAQSSPAVGTNGGAYLVVWTDLQADCTTSISAAAVDANGQTGPVRMLAQNANPETRPAIAWNGSEYVVVWDRTAAAQLVGMRVAADGNPIDPEPVAMTASYPDPMFYTHHTGFPAIVWTGQEYLAAWTFSRTSSIPWYPDPPPILEVRTRRFTRGLLPVGTENVLATPAYGSTLGWNGTEALALWHERESTYAARIAADGHVVATNLIGPSTSPTPPSLSIAWSGLDWIVADGAQLLRIRADGSFASRTDLGASVRGSAATPTVVAYERSEGEVMQVFTRKLPRPRRRAVR